MPKVCFPPGNSVIDVPSGTRLIEAIRRANLPIASSCGDELVCGKCGVRILEGQVTREAAIERDAKARNRVPSDQRLACVIRVHRDLVVTADYWGETA